MFTGIIEEVGRVGASTPQRDGVRLRLDAAHVLSGIRIGDSIAVDGVCLTVVAFREGGFEVDVIGTTLSRTTLGRLRPADPVNLERSLALGERLGGHIVQGHVDGLGVVRAITPSGGHVLLDVEVPAGVAEVTVPHGSIAIAGVSLTVNEQPAPNVVQVALIPHTWGHTTLSGLKVGDPVNLEGDLFGKFVLQYLKRRGGGGVS